MLRYLFLSLFIIYKLASFSQSDPVYTDDEYKDYWFDINGRPLLKEENYQNDKGQNLKNNQQRTITNIPNQNSSNKTDPKNQISGNSQQITLEKINYNSSRKFKVSNWIVEKRNSFEMENQVQEISLKIPQEDFDILQSSPLILEFILDQKEKRARFVKFQILFKKSKNDIKIECWFFDRDGEHQEGEFYSNFEGKEYLKYKLFIGLGYKDENNKKVLFNINLKESYKNDKIIDTTLLYREFLDDENILGLLDVGITKINEIVVKFDGDKKNVKAIDQFIISDKSKYRKIQNNKSKRKAIIIANDYTGSNLDLNGYPTSDANELSNIISAKDGLWNIQKLYNKSKDSLKNYFSNADNFSNFDTLFIFYAGHGLSTNFGKEDEKIWKDYWVPNDFREDFDKISKSEESMKPVLNKLYSISDLLADINSSYLKTITSEEAMNKIKVIILSDACREDITKRGLIRNEQVNRSANDIKFDFLFLPVVAPGQLESNKRSWTKLNLIETLDYRNRSFSGLPEIQNATPWTNTMRNGKDSKPFHEIYLLK